MSPLLPPVMEYEKKDEKKDEEEVTKEGRK